MDQYPSFQSNNLLIVLVANTETKDVKVDGTTGLSIICKSHQAVSLHQQVTPMLERIKLANTMVNLLLKSVDITMSKSRALLNLKLILIKVQYQ